MEQKKKLLICLSMSLSYSFIFSDSGLGYFFCWRCNGVAWQSCLFDLSLLSEPEQTGNIQVNYHYLSRGVAELNPVLLADLCWLWLVKYLPSSLGNSNLKSWLVSGSQKDKRWTIRKSCQPTDWKWKFKPHPEILNCLTILLTGLI